MVASECSNARLFASLSVRLSVGGNHLKLRRKSGEGGEEEEEEQFQNLLYLHPIF
jgi:hypothetical protein